MSKIIVEAKYEDGLKLLVNGALENEIKFISIGLKKTKRNIKKYENKFKTNSEVFYKEYSSGNLGDKMDYIKWAGEIETLKKLEKNLKDLAEVEVC